MYAGYAMLSGQEVWSNRRTLDYLAGDPLAGIVGLAPATTVVNRSSASPVDAFLCGGAPGGRFRSPALDDAPWFDVDVPASADFAGLLVEEITGFDSPVNREITTSALLGGFLGPLNMKPRSLTVTGWLRGRTCAATEYGLHWLTETLMSDSGCDDSVLGDLFMLRSAPTGVITGTTDLSDYGRVMLRVGLADGPKVTDRSGVCCGDCGSTMLRVQFTLVAEVPYIFSDLDWVAFGEQFTEGPFDYDLSFPCRSGCNDTPEPWTPECASVLVPPPIPFFVPDDCYCEPWTSKRICTSFSNPKDWSEMTTQIIIEAGSRTVKNLKLVAFRNSPGLAAKPCPCDWETDPNWRCVDPCASLAVSEIPSGGKLIVDSRQRTIELVLPGGRKVPGMQFVSSGERAVPFEWFDVGHCTSLCLVASVQVESVLDDVACGGPCFEDGILGTEIVTDPDVRISIGLSNRYVASGG